jgi:hypothetical protein
MKRATSSSERRVRIGSVSKLLLSSISFLKRRRSLASISMIVARPSMVFSRSPAREGVISSV